MKIEYTKVGDYYLLNFYYLEETRPIGFWGIILEPVLRDAGQEMWQVLDRIISAKNAMEGHVAKEMYIRGFLDYERLVCEKDSNI